MRIAVPVIDGLLSQHFGHSEKFTFFRVSDQDATFVPDGEAMPPAHGHGVLPRWLSERDVKVVIAGGIGSRALSLFEGTGITVVSGAPSHTPERIVREFLAGSLQTTSEACADSHEGHACGRHNGACMCGDHR